MLLQAVAASVALWVRYVALDLVAALGVGGRGGAASPPAPARLTEDVATVVRTLVGGCGAVLPRRAQVLHQRRMLL